MPEPSKTGEWLRRHAETIRGPESRQQAREGSDYPFELASEAAIRAAGWLDDLTEVALAMLEMLDALAPDVAPDHYDRLGEVTGRAEAVLRRQGVDIYGTSRVAAEGEGRADA